MELVRVKEGEDREGQGLSGGVGSVDEEAGMGRRRRKTHFCSELKG